MGSFHHPKAVLIDPHFLKSLPDREFVNGMAEVCYCLPFLPFLILFR
ncbi:hypothetical protein M1146_06890 [Patescibacteria group bacterium]|nr:hypothetical protein [Patescibacteria group bacterium]